MQFPSPYLYTGGNPVNMTDPTGMNAFSDMFDWEPDRKSYQWNNSSGGGYGSTTVGNNQLAASEKYTTSLLNRSKSVATFITTTLKRLQEITNIVKELKKSGEPELVNAAEKASFTFTYTFDESDNPSYAHTKIYTSEIKVFGQTIRNAWSKGEISINENIYTERGLNLYLNYFEIKGTRKDALRHMLIHEFLHIAHPDIRNGGKILHGWIYKRTDIFFNKLYR